MGYSPLVKFVLEVNLPDDADVNGEVSRILRYWGGAMKDLTELEPGDKQDIYDSNYARVGSWHVTADAE
ncbi:hypothetical protein MLIT_15540 [Mycolicibacterium litorale]|uniref:Uncharacterized protein n=1 Tax=Mycolicibacterium litorale TaxID=758802 RepID=A0AAD1IHZ8_9MYCO|nr:hypothetical protein MLIT_15540 [Mycolicibacterium litorale]